MGFEQLGYVSPGEPIRAEAWNAMVDAVLDGPDNSFRVRSKKRRGTTVMPVQVSGSWTKVNNEWKASGRPILALDPLRLGSPVQVFAPTASSVPTPTRFYVVRRNGRWEKIDTENIQSYTGGLGISASGREISTSAILSAFVPHMEFALTGDRLYFDHNYFTYSRPDVGVIPTDQTHGLQGISLKPSLFHTPSISASASGNTITIEIEV